MDWDKREKAMLYITRKRYTLTLIWSGILGGLALFAINQFIGVLK